MTTNHPISTRLLSLFTIIILLFGLAGCNSGSKSTDNATKNKDYANETFNIYYSVKDSDLVINKDTEKWGELKCGECTYYEFDSYSANSTEKNLFHNVMIIRTSNKAMSWFLYDDNGFSTYMLKDNLGIDSHSEKHKNFDVLGGENDKEAVNVFDWYSNKFFKDFETGNFLYVRKNEDGNLCFRINHKLRAVIPENDFDIKEDDTGEYYLYKFKSNDVSIYFYYYLDSNSVLVLDGSSYGFSGIYEYWEETESLPEKSTTPSTDTTTTPNTDIEVDFNVNVDERILVSGTIMSTENLTIGIGKYCLQLEEPITIKLNDPYFADSSKIYQCSVLCFYDDTELIDSSETSYYLTDNDIGKKCSIFARLEDYRRGGNLYFLYPEIWFD